MTEVNVKPLEKLLKALKAKPVFGRIGILGKDQRQGEEVTNAEVGAFHEFGTSQLPVRSFLRIPITERLNKELVKAGGVDEDTMKEVVRTGTVVPWIKKILIVAEGIVIDAFDTGGFGKWPPSNMANKTNHQTLVETAQLRNSITTEVKEE